MAVISNRSAAAAFVVQSNATGRWRHSATLTGTWAELKMTKEIMRFRARGERAHDRNSSLVGYGFHVGLGAPGVRGNSTDDGRPLRRRCRYDIPPHGVWYSTAGKLVTHPCQSGQVGRHIDRGSPELPHHLRRRSPDPEPAYPEPGRTVPALHS